jgi:hypothetical protein
LRWSESKIAIAFIEKSVALKSLNLLTGCLPHRIVILDHAISYPSPPSSPRALRGGDVYLR